MSEFQTDRPPRPPKNVVEMVEVGNVMAEVSARDHTDREGNTRTYFDVEWLRTYYKDGERIITKTFQFRDLDRMMELVAKTKNAVSGLIRALRDQDSEKDDFQ